MRVLVLGGSGFIGSHIVDALLAKGHSVRVFDRGAELYRPTPPAAEFIQGDFSSEADLAAALSDVDTVFHLVSTTVPSTANLDPVADIEGNLIATVRLLALMRDRGIKRLLYLSSGGTVYGIPQTDTVTEDHPLAPISSYGIVKVAIENYIRMEADLHGLLPLILRPSNPYGPRQGHGGIQGAIGTFMWRAARGEPIELWGDGSVVRDFIHIGDLARLCLCCAETDKTGTFNAGFGQGHSIRDILETVARVSGKTLTPDIKPGRKFDVPRIVLDISAAKQELGWQPEISLEKGLSETWQWICDQSE